jgi:hypothetical protein
MISAMISGPPARPIFMGTGIPGMLISILPRMIPKNIPQG